MEIEYIFIDQKVFAYIAIVIIFKNLAKVLIKICDKDKK